MQKVMKIKSNEKVYPNFWLVVRISNKMWYMIKKKGQEMLHRLYKQGGFLINSEEEIIPHWSLVENETLIHKYKQKYTNIFPATWPIQTLNVSNLC